MSKQLDEPAFPVTDCQEHEFVGMTLRDYFAAKAMQGICSHHDTWGRQVNEIAQAAYELADAMLAERSRS